MISKRQPRRDNRGELTWALQRAIDHRNQIDHLRSLLVQDPPRVTSEGAGVAEGVWHGLYFDRRGIAAVLAVMNDAWGKKFLADCQREDHKDDPEVIAAYRAIAAKPEVAAAALLYGTRPEDEEFRRILGLDPNPAHLMGDDAPKRVDLGQYAATWDDLAWFLPNGQKVESLTPDQRRQNEWPNLDVDADMIGFDEDTTDRRRTEEEQARIDAIFDEACRRVFTSIRDAQDRPAHIKPAPSYLTDPFGPPKLDPITGKPE